MKLKVIIVDDEPMARNFLERYCEKNGNLLVSGDVDTVVRRVQPTRQIAVRPLTPDPVTMGALRGAITGQPFVERITASPENTELFVAYTGNMEAQAALLRHLMVDAGLPIASFAEAALDLEDVFLRVTTGAVH